MQDNPLNETALESHDPSAGQSHKEKSTAATLHAVFGSIHMKSATIAQLKGEWLEGVR
jgi:hypothetical protein